MKNLIIWWSMRWWKTSSTISMHQALHWDDIRRDVLEKLSPLESKLLLPKYSRYLNWEFSFEDLLRTFTPKDYLEMERYESWTVYYRWIEPIIKSWWNDWVSWNVIEWVQLLPEKLVETLKWKEEMFKVIFLVKTDLDRVLSFVNDSLDNWENSVVWKDFVSRSLQTPLREDKQLRVAFADLIVAYWREILYSAKECWFDVIETSWEKSLWIKEI